MVFLVILIGLIVYFLSMFSPALYIGKKTVKKTVLNKLIVTGHRGAAGLAPENTLAAISAGLKQGVQRIEIDVRQTKDGQVICIHDASIDRTTDGKGLVKDMTFNEITKYSAGVKFSKAFKDEKIPLLEQALQLIDSNATLLIEIKDGNEIYPGIEQKVVDLVNKYKDKSPAIIHSFNDSVLFRIHKMDSSIILHKLLIADFPFLQLLTDGSLKITNLEYYSFVTEFSIYYQFATKRFINHVHKLNKKVNVWTVNDKATMGRLINMGVDGVITNFPNYLRRDTVN